MNARRRREDRKLGGPAAAALLAGLVVTGCLIGALTRPIGLLAPFWPTNAIMVGVLLRIPAARSPLGWLAGAADAGSFPRTGRAARSCWWKEEETEGWG